MSARAVSVVKVARIWPFFTASPTFTVTCASRSPLTSAPTLASCQALTLPLASSVMGRVSSLGSVTETVITGFGAAAAAACAGAPPAGLRSDHTSAASSTTAITAASTSHFLRPVAEEFSELMMDS